jgi:hypothetical protein
MTEFWDVCQRLVLVAIGLTVTVGVIHWIVGGSAATSSAERTKSVQNGPSAAIERPALTH